jgi:hypothetical protein
MRGQAIREDGYHPRTGISRLYAASHMPQGDKIMIDSYKILKYKYIIRCDLCEKPLDTQVNECENLTKIEANYAGLGFRTDDGILCVEDKAGMCDFHICNACIATIYRSHKSRLDNRD